jgi:hypothetical protein
MQTGALLNRREVPPSEMQARPDTSPSGRQRRQWFSCASTDDPANRTLRVHFIAYNPTPQTLPVNDRPSVLSGLIEDAPMFRASILTQEPVKEATALNPATELRREGRRVRVTITDLHDVLVLRY